MLCNHSDTVESVRVWKKVSHVYISPTQALANFQSSTMAVWDPVSISAERRGINITYHPKPCLEFIMSELPWIV